MELHEKIKCEFYPRQKGDCNSTNWKRHVDSCKEKVEVEGTNEMSQIFLETPLFEGNIH